MTNTIYSKDSFMDKVILLIGALGKKGVVYDGETMKNAIFKKHFEKVATKVSTINTTKWNRKPWLPFELIYKLLRYRKATIVISACDISAYRLIKFLYYIRLNNNIFYWVVGGGFPTLVGNKINPKYLRFIKKILVQSPVMEKKLKDKGITNATYFPNSKDIYKIKKNHSTTNRIKFVYLSRIIPEKGCDLIINCANRLHKNGYKFSIDFYGNINAYPDFQKKISAIKEITYKGLLDLRKEDGFLELAKNDIFLFPTFHLNEGFPGVFIDAFISGLPVITTDWNYNKEIITDGITGLIIPPQSEDALYDAMLYFINDPTKIKRMSDTCIKEAHKYDSNQLLGIDNLKSIGLI